MVRIFTLMTATLICWMQATPVKADSLRTFLVASAYGTVIGAGVGLASLAVADDPSGRISNVARGASLGLYAGMATGFYLNSQPAKSSYDSEYGKNEKSPVMVAPQFTALNKVDGVQVQWMILNY